MNLDPIRSGVSTSPICQCGAGFISGCDQGLHPQKVLAWRISSTLQAGFCVDALNEAVLMFGPPEIMKTVRGSQFTSFLSCSM